MKLKEFDKNKSLSKLHLKHNKETYIRQSSLFISAIVLVVGIIYFTFAAFESKSDAFVLMSARVGDFSAVCEYIPGYTWEFDYTGGMQEFNVPCSGTYKLEVWGAQGGSVENSVTGGYGGYSTGTVQVDNTDNLYLGIGGSGTCGNYTTNYGGFNGGGNAEAPNNYVNCSGGGATHISTSNNTLANLSDNRSSVLIVAGGGGGASFARDGDKGDGGNGGGIQGNGGITNAMNNIYTTGGTQNGSGCYMTSESLYNNSCNGGFGYGADVLNNESGRYHGGAGGGGYFGGGAPTYTYSPGGGGGSGYIASNSLLSNSTLTKHMYCYNCTTSPSSQPSTYTISNGTNSCVNSNANSDCAKSGNGYAKITLVATTQNVEVPEVKLYDGMVPVYFKDGDTYVADTSDANWYNYADHKWANAVLVADPSTYLDSNGNVKSAKKNTQITSGILQYYVWIPRYKYKLFNVNFTSKNEQMIEIEFESANHKSNGRVNNAWLTHPAFTFGNTELEGIWVGKFETSSSDGIQITGNQLSSKVSNIRILPNMVTATNNNIYNMYTVSRAIESSATFGLTANQVDTHMMKNTEWGVVAYLSQSKYGIYKENGSCYNLNQSESGSCKVFINNVNVGYGNDANTNNLSFQWGSSVTGCSAASSGASVLNTHNQTNPTCTNNYKWNENGILATTTGNMYGLYDMSGGAWEYVMGNQSSSTTTYVYFEQNSGLSSKPEDKYLDNYLAAATDTNVMSDDDQSKVQNRGHFGDATSEIIKNYGNLAGAWNNDYAIFPTSSRPWLSRGGRAADAINAGVFSFNRGLGNANASISFRIVLTKQDGNN